MSGRGRYIRASEVGEYVYCARAWRLRAEGETWHLAHGREVVHARRMRLLAKFAFLLALAAGLLLLWLNWR